MTIKLSFPPENIHDVSWKDWYLKLRNAIVQVSNQFVWSSINKAGSNITDIVTRNHQDLQSIQGGNTTERYHLTSAQQSELTGGGDTALHYHTADRASGLSITITTAKLTSGGSTGSMVFTNGVLTSQTQAT